MIDFETLKTGLTLGDLVPVLGPGALAGAVDQESGAPVPADSRSLILAMNNGREMMPRLMYEFSRAAQHVEQRRGQAAVTRFLERLYSRPASPSLLHRALAALQPHWVVDINRDLTLLQSYAHRPHTLIQGGSRIMGEGKRYRLFHYDGHGYTPVAEEAVDTALPMLFKPLGCPRPEPRFIASDADFVDYLTELMGGFAIPAFVKQYRRQKQYLLLGVPLNRDTERMLVTEISYDAGAPRGWVFLAEPSDKERRFCARMGLEILEAPLEAFTDYLLDAVTPAQALSQ